MKEKDVKEILNYVKNPIGIIGMFLVLVEAIAAFVIVQSSLSDELNLILVLFISIFPFIVLYIFYLLVTKHHKKLYSPSDYRDEKNFVRTYNNLTQSEELVEKDEHKMEYFSQTQDGMNKKDIDLIKETLNSVVELQKQLFIQNKGHAQITAVEKVEKNIKERLDAYAVEKQNKYMVQVSLMKKSEDFVQRLIDRGYIAQIYNGFDSKEEFEYSEHEAIWLGRNVPVDMVIDVVKFAKAIFPHLKYIDFSIESAPEQAHCQIYIGGATRTAKARKLRRLDLIDFEKIYKLKSQEELHKYIVDINS